MAPIAVRLKMLFALGMIKLCVEHSIAQKKKKKTERMSVLVAFSSCVCVNFAHLLLYNVPTRFPIKKISLVGPFLSYILAFCDNILLYMYLK